MPPATYLPLFELTRGNTLESLHFGAIAIVDVDGRLVAQHGDPNATTFLRSTAKPFQALPLLENGGADFFDLSSSEIALMCASHSGTDEHVETLISLQRKTGISQFDLMCGVHPPMHAGTAEAMRQRGEEATQNRHNCSGKHTGMLAFARMQGWPMAGYLKPSHPVQQAILRTFAEMCDLPADRVLLGVDGCSAPNFAIPLAKAALAYARLCDPNDLAPARAQACQKIGAAMTSHPEMVAGPYRFDTRLMQATGGRIVAKGGAEGYQGVGLMPDAVSPGSPALGIALKISDGDLKGRVRPPLVLEILRQLGALSGSELETLSDYGPTTPVYNWRRLEVGQARPNINLSNSM
jgi:L-asparaginase II